MDKTKALQKLLDGTASEEDVELLKHLLVSGEISIGGNVNNSVLTLGSGNNIQIIQLTPEALDRLNARPMLGNLDRDLTGDEIASGLRRLDKLLPNRAPVLLPHYKEQVGRLRPTLKTEIKALSETARRERLEALAAINSICVEALDISFNGIALGEEAPKYDARSPFRGLESFRPEDSEFFFGREALTQKLVGKIKAHPFLAVLGASGSGKSSLVMAGVIPALVADYIIFRPGANPLDELESARGKSLIVVDQFEELFTLARTESTRKEFIARLLDEATRSRIILTLRSDFLGEVGAYRALSEEIQSYLEIVPPMDMDELRRAMEGQAGVVGLRFEADLSQQILDEVAGEPGAMPLLQHALWELWNRRHGRNLRASEYRAFGGVKQAITSTAEKVYADCSKPEQDTLRDIFLRLTRLDEGDEGRDTRRRVPLGDLIPSGRDAASITLLLDKLANARLVVKTVNDDKTEVEVAHEALIRHWERLRLWLNEDRDNLRLREGIIDVAKQWESSGKDESLLIHRAGRLDDAVSLSKDAHYGLTNVEQAYLKECVAYQKKEQNRRERLRKQITTGLGVGFVIVLAVSILAVFQWQRAERQTGIAVARQLAVQAQPLFVSGNSKHQTAVLLAIQSMQIFPGSEAAQILQNNTLAHPIFRIPHDFAYRYAKSAIAFSPNGKYIVSGGCDQLGAANNCTQGSARVWEVATGKEITRMVHEGSVNSLAFSPDGKYVVSGSGDGTTRVWETTTGKEIARMMHDSLVTSVAFSPNGKYIVSGGCDQLGADNNCTQGSARVWEVATGKEITRMTHKTALMGSVPSAIFSSDSRYVVSWGWEDNTVYVWEANIGRETSHMTHDIYVTSVAFSPDGKYVASVSLDKTVRVWNAFTGKEVARMTHDGAVISVAFSPNGKYVVSGSEDNTARVWEVATGKEISRMTHKGSVNSNSIAFSPNGKYVVSGSMDNTARVWEVATGKEIAHMMHDDFVRYVAFSPDGKYVVSGSWDKTARVWNAATGKEISRMTHNGSISSVAFSPDGKYVVSGNSDVIFSRDDTSARVWEASTGKEISRMTHNGSISSVAFSPDGRYVISGSADKTIRVWEVDTGKEITRMTLDGEVNSVAVSRDGKYVVSGECDQPDNLACDQGSARVWIYRPEDLIADACSRVTRNLTRAEWDQYIGDALPYQAVCPNLPIEP